MNKRTILKLLTTGVISGGIVFASYPFLSSMGVSAKARNDDLAVIELPKLSPGQIVKVNVNGQELIFLKPDEEQKEAIRVLNDHVWDSDSAAYRQDVGAYVYWGVSTKWGCPLEHKPEQVSRIIKWDESAKWLGGYWDWQCEVSYDYAGRSIRSYAYSFNGYNAEHPNLASPNIFKESNGKYVVSSRER